MQEIKNTSPITRLKQLITREQEDIRLLLMLSLGYGILTIAMPLAVQTLVNSVVIGGVIQPLIIVSVILLALLILSSIIYLSEVYLVEIIQRRVFVRLSFRIAKNMNGVRLSAYEQQNPVELMNRFFDVMTIQKAAATLLTLSLTALLQGFIGSLIILFYSVYFAGPVIVIAFVLFWIVFILGKSAQETAIKESTSKYKMAAWLEYLAKNTVLTKFFNAKSRTLYTTDQLAIDYVNKRKKHFGILLKQRIGIFTMYTLLGTGILVMSGLLVINGVINIGQFVAAELIIFGVLTAFVRFVNKLDSFYDMLAAMHKVGVLLDLPQESEQTQHHLNQVKSLHVALVNNFADDRQHARDTVSFDLQQGQSLAIIGQSGAGKSTLAAMITGLRTFKDGTIQYNGNDIRQLDLDQLRNKVALVDQAELVEGTIMDNLVVFNPQVGLAAVNHYLDRFNLLDEINALEKGLDTPLNSDGQPLSSTQLKFMVIIRGLLADTEMMVLDGILDHFTADELEVVIMVLETYQKDKLLLVLTRLTLVADCFDQQVKL